MPEDDLEVHDVGIVVFMRAPGVDALDAAHRADAAIRRAINEAVDDDGALLDRGPQGTGAAMPVDKTMEVGTAARNGYLWVRPTRQAARDRGVA